MGRRVAIVNNKGGAGKTVTAVGLAEAAALLGAWVLVVDMDPQANATRRLQAVAQDAPVGVRRSLTTVLLPGGPDGGAREFQHKCGWDMPGEFRIDVLTSDMDLEDRTQEVGHPGSFMRLRRALYGMDAGYDLTIIDCPPSVKGHLTQMALSALDGDDDTVLVPLTLDQDGIGGAFRGLEFIRLWRNDLGVPRLEPAGLVVNNYRTGTVLHETRRDGLGQLLDTLPTLASLPQRTALAEVQDAGLPLSSDKRLTALLAEFDGVARVLLPGLAAERFAEQVAARERGAA